MRIDLPASSAVNHRHASGLVDVLDRVLDKGLAIAGDIKVSLAEVELLTIRIRLIVCSIDKAQEIGLDWWKYDPHFAPGRAALSESTTTLRKELSALQQKVAALGADRDTARRNGRRTRRRRRNGG
jgi:hypothetical protein